MSCQLWKKTLREQGLGDELIDQALEAERVTAERREQVRRLGSVHSLRVLEAFQQEGLCEQHFSFTTGYGYGDPGREMLDAVLSRLFRCPAALLRTQCVSGTHAIAAGLLGNLRPGEELVSLSGAPYDTLQSIIGSSKVPAWGSLCDMGVLYRELPLTDQGGVDIENIASVLGPKTSWVFLQRSRGYQTRPSLTIQTLEKVIGRVKQLRPQVQVFVDNCYGELVEDREPTEVGADLVAGSLIKNLGAGIAPTGGYLAGQTVPVERAATRLIAPCIGSEVGPHLGLTRAFVQGLFLAPQIVSTALEGSIWAAYLLESLGYRVSPRWEEARTDLVLEVVTGSAQRQQAFIGAIQRSGAVDSQAVPEGWLQPGYTTPVLMASASFVAGSSIELSADGPQRPPFSCYLQGGLNLAQIQLAVLRAVMNCAGIQKNQLRA